MSTPSASFGVRHVGRQAPVDAAITKAAHLHPSVRILAARVLLRPRGGACKVNS